MDRGHVAAPRVEHAVGCAAGEVHHHRRHLSSVDSRDGGAGAGRIAADGDQVVAERQVLERLVRNDALVPLVEVRQAKRRGGPKASKHRRAAPAELPRQRNPAADRCQVVGNLVCVPRLGGKPERIEAAEHIRLREIHAYAAIQ